MKRLLVLFFLLSSCALFRPGGPDLGALADEVALYQSDIEAVSPLASPELQEDLARLLLALDKVQVALRAADTGAPLDDVIDYAEAALSIADAIAAELAPESDLRFAIALARVFLNHIAAGELREAADEDAVAIEAAAKT